MTNYEIPKRNTLIWSNLLFDKIPRRVIIGVNSGLRQGNTLSPTLFNIASEKVIREISKRQQMETVGKESILTYTDDVGILGNTRQ